MLGLCMWLMAAWSSSKQHHSHMCCMRTLVSGLEVAVKIGELGGKFWPSRINGLVISAPVPAEHVCCSVWVHPAHALWAWGSLCCALLGDVDVLAGPAWWAEAAGEPISVLFPRLSFTSGGKKPRYIWQGFCLLLCFESWETKHPGKLKVRSFSHLQHCQIAFLASDVRNLKKFWTWLNPHCQGTQCSIYSYSTLSFWSSRNLGENWHQALRYLSS